MISVMVKHKHQICTVVLAAVLAIAFTAPAPDCTLGHKDNRQNGTQNYRIKIDDVMVAVAPQVAPVAASDLYDLFDISIEDLSKPNHDWSINLVKPVAVNISSEPVKQETKKPDISTRPPPSDVGNDDFLSAPDAPKNNSTAEKLEEVRRLKKRLANVLEALTKRIHHQ